jgi:hypothetical protein
MSPTVLVHLWGVPARGVPGALARMVTSRPALRRHPVPRFAKLLGTGTGATFTPRDADPRHWALLTVWDDPRAAVAFEDTGLVRRWDARAEERLRLRMSPLSATGSWARRRPFAPADPDGDRTGPVAALTRARLRPSRTAAFWRAVPPVSAELHRSPGLRLALAVGEAPIGLQGTLSLWGSDRALTDFAYRPGAHRDVVARTPAARWYAEESFARLAVHEVEGTYRGRTP